MIGMSMNEDMTPQKMQVLASAYWVVISFFIALIIILLILRKRNRLQKLKKQNHYRLGHQYCGQSEESSLLFLHK